jgi:hypothetical protein
MPLDESARGDETDIADALDADPGSGDLLQSFEGRNLEKPLRRQKNTEAGRLEPAGGSAEIDGLPGDHGAVVLARMHLIERIEYPGHGFLIGVEIGCGNIDVWTDVVSQLVHVAPGQPPELVGREFLGIADHPTLGAAERNVQERGLPRHQCRQGGDLGFGHIGVIADAALSRTSNGVVQDAIAVKRPDGTIVHLHRKTNGDGSLRRLEEFDEALFETVQMGPCPAELFSDDFEGIKAFGLHFLVWRRLVR